HQLFKSRWARHLETTEGQAAYLAEWQSLGGWEKGSEYYDAFMQADADAVVSVSRRYLGADNAAAVVYRPRGSEAVAHDATAFRSLLDGGHVTPLSPSACREPELRPRRSRVEFVREEASVRVYRLASGIPLLLRQRTNAAITHAGVYAATGSAYEPRAEAGITALAARTVARGTQLRTALQIAEESELLGGSIGASVGAEVVGWSFSVPAGNVTAAISLLADVVQHATLDDDALETERTAMIADAARMRDDMYRYPMRLATEAAFGDHPYSIPSGGSEESLRGLTPDSVRGWYQTMLLHAPFVIALTGDFLPDDMAGDVAAAFESLVMQPRDSLPEPQWPARSVELCVRRDKTQSALVLAFPGPSRRDEDRFAAHVLASVASGLGGRFFEELRDRRSLAYTVHAFGAEHQLAGRFMAYIATAPERESEARSALLQQFAILRDEPITNEEITRAKRFMLGMHDIRQESGGAVLADMVDSWLFGAGLHEMDEVAARIEAVTAADIQELARAYFDPTRVVEGVVRGAPAAVSA
ncbi:MAG: pitrilysin family protein, partial [Gemmatimonadaceae bacterium]